jgi:hypothetical protein
VVVEIGCEESAPEESRDDFEVLVVRYLDGLGTPDEARILGEQLASSVEKRNQFAALCVQIGVLGEMSMKSRAAGLEGELLAENRQTPLAPSIAFPDLRNSVDDALCINKPVSRVPANFRRALGRGRQWLGASRWRVAGVGLAIGLLIAGILWVRPREASPLNAQREPQLIASLKNSSQAKWRDGLSLPNGAQFSEGQVLELVEGHAQVSVSCGAEVVMRGPCSVQLVASNQLLLREGLVCVQLADWTDGFTVATESVQILDLGKQFVVSAEAKSGAVEAHAIDGKLRVQTTNVPLDKRYGMLVTEGEAIRIQPASNTSMRLKANGRLFDTSLDVSRPYKPVEIHNTGRGLTAGDEDPHWRIVNSSANDFGRARYAVACRAYENMYLPNDPAVSQWISTSNPVGNCPPDTMYTFETEFNLTGYDLSTVTIVAHVLADNGVMGVHINGHSVAFKPWSAVYGQFDTYRKIEIADGFVEGVNRIQFDVWNSIVMSYPNENNPMALRVEWQAFGRMKSRTGARSVPVGDDDGSRGQLSNTTALQLFKRHF